MQRTAAPTRPHEVQEVVVTATHSARVYRQPLIIRFDWIARETHGGVFAVLVILILRVPDTVFTRVGVVCVFLY